MHTGSSGKASGVFGICLFCILVVFHGFSSVTSGKFWNST